MYEIELVTYSSNYVDVELEQSLVLTTRFFSGDATDPFDSAIGQQQQQQECREVDQGAVEVESLAPVRSPSSDGKQSVELGFDPCSPRDYTLGKFAEEDVDRLSLDSNTVAVDWDTEEGSFLTFHKVSDSSMYQQGYSKGYTMTLNNRVKSEASFTSYIDFEADDGLQDGIQMSPDLLEGELCISKADRVCSYSTISGLTSGMSGTLFVTTLKLSLKLHIEDELKARNNKLLGPWDIPLSSIYAIYEIFGDTGEKKKRLNLGTSVSSKVDGIFIMCKNFKFFRFSFKFAKIDQGRNVVNALLHHVRPKKNNLLFAFEQHVYTVLGVSYLRTGWETLLSKSQVKNVRITRSNENWQVSQSLPQEFIVPDHVTDDKLSRLAGLFVGNRLPVWVWGTPDGGALFIQPLLNVLTSQQVDQQRMEFYGGQLGRRIKEIDLERLFPHQSIIEDSYSAMLDLHCLESEKEADKIDSEYFSRLESCGWLSLVSTALRTSVEVCEMMWKRKTVILVEGEGRGSSILVASLVEILLEEDTRTRAGFQTLIQNNWVSLGFPFSTNHQLCSPRAENSIVPIFLIFLDSVFQLTQQFPSLFEFLPEYLIDLWDTALLPIFDTFIFDSEHDRSMARRNPETPLNPSPAWNWESQFSKQYIKDWENPLFGVPRRPERNNVHDPHPHSMIMDKQLIPGVPEDKKYLPVCADIPSLSVWLNFFHRSVTFFQRSTDLNEKLLKVQREAKSIVDSIYSKTQRLN